MDSTAPTTLETEKDTLIGNINQWLPQNVKEGIEDEAEEWRQAIKEGFARTVIDGDYRSASSAIKLFHKYLDLKYKFSLADKQDLARTLFDLIITPSIDLKIQTRFASALNRLLKAKEDLGITLDWKPIYRILNDTYFRKNRSLEYMPKDQHSTAMVDLVRRIRKYFPASATEELFEELRPQLCPYDHIVFKAQGFLCLFVPTWQLPRCTWIEECLALWDMIELSPYWDVNFMATFARLAEQSAGRINFEPYMPLLFTHVLQCLDLPVGNPPPRSAYNRMPMSSCNLFIPFSHVKTSLMDTAAHLLVWLLSPSSSAMSHLKKLFKAIENFYHPSNGGAWTNNLGQFMLKLCKEFACRTRKERDEGDVYKIPEQYKLNDELCKEFVEIMLPIAQMALFSKNHRMCIAATQTIKHLAHLRPASVFPTLMETIFHALTTLTETHQTVAALETLTVCLYPLLDRAKYPEGADYLSDILTLTLPGLDANDMLKTHATLRLYSVLLSIVPLIPTSDSGSYSDASPSLSLDGLSFSDLSTNDDDVRPAAIDVFESWVMEFLERIFVVLSHQNPPKETGADVGTASQIVQSMGPHAALLGDAISTGLFSETFHLFFMQMSSNLFNTCVKRICEFIQGEFLWNAIKNVGHLITAASHANPEVALAKLVPIIYDKLVTVDKGGNVSLNNLTASETQWYLHMLSSAVDKAGSAMLKYKKQLMTLVRLTWESEEHKILKTSGKLVRNILRTLTMVYPLESRSHTPSVWKSRDFQTNHWKRWGQFHDKTEVDLMWHIPSDDETNFAKDLINQFIKAPFTRLQEYVKQVDQSATDEGTKSSLSSPSTKRKVIDDLLRLRYLFRGASTFFPEIDNDIIDHHSEKQFTGKIAIGLPTVPHQDLAVNRYDVVSVFDSMMQSLMKHREDEPKILSKIAKTLYIVTNVRGERRSHNQAKRKGHLLRRSLVLQSSEERKKLPRAILVERAHLQYQHRLAQHYAHLQYSRIHSALMHDLLELSLSSYSVVRKATQNVFLAMTKKFSHSVLKQLLPRVIAVLSDKTAKPEQVTGAVYLLTGQTCIRKITQDWDLLSQFMLAITQTSHIEKASVQARVNQLFMTYSLSYTNLSLFRPKFRPSRAPGELVDQNEEHNKLKHTTLFMDLMGLLDKYPTGHWRFLSMVYSYLVLLIRADIFVPIEGCKLFLKGLVSDLSGIRQLSAKALGYIFTQHKPIQPRKLVDTDKRAFTLQEQSDLANNPPRNQQEWEHTHFYDKNYYGWYRRPAKTMVYVYDEAEFNNNDVINEDVTVRPHREQLIKELKPILESPEFIPKFFELYGVQQRSRDNSFVNGVAQLFKGFFQIFGPDFLTTIKPHLEKLLSHSGSGTQEERSYVAFSCEIIGGLMRAMKHWKYDAIEQAYAYILPLCEASMRSCSQSCIHEWSSCMQFAAYDRDVRRCKWLFDFLISKIDLSSGSPGAQERSLRYIHPVISEFSWRNKRVSDNNLQLLLPHLAHPYLQVRERISLLLASAFSYQWSFARDETTGLPLLSVPAKPEQSLLNFIHEVSARYEDLKARALKEEAAMAQRHQQESASTDAEMRDSELEQVLASEADAPAIFKTFSKTILYFMLHLFHAGHSLSGVAYVPYILSLLSSIHSSQQVSGVIAADDELQMFSKQAFIEISMCSFPSYLVEQIMKSLHSMLLISPDTNTNDNNNTSTAGSMSWHVRSSVLLFLQSFAYRHQFYILNDNKAILFEKLVSSLRDPQLEVRELACTSLAGFIKIADADTIESLKKQFESIVASSTPKRTKKATAATTVPAPSSATTTTTTTETAAITRHSGILGLSALVLAFPYDIPEWMPEVLVMVANYQNDRYAPIANTVRKTLGDFWRTHRDMWQTVHKHKFTEDQLLVLTDLLVSPSYYA